MAILLANYHKDKNYLFLPHEDRAYSYAEVVEEAKKYHTELVGVKIPNTEELARCDKFPIIVTLQQNKTKHSVVIYRISSQNVYYYDPCLGKRKEKLISFNEKWTKSAIIVTKSEKTSCPFIPPTFVAKKDKITLPILQILSGVSLMIGSYFIDKEFPIFIPIALFAGFVIFELLFRQNLINAMKRMDENFYTYEVKCDPHNYYALYQDVEQYRYQALSSYSSYIYSSLIIVFLTFILIMNSKYNALYVLIALFIALFDVMGYRPYFKAKNNEIVEQEENIKNAENGYEFQHYAREARERSYKLSLSKSVFSYLSIALLLMVIILVMAISNTVNVTYVVFYLCISIFLKDEFSKIFTFATTSEDFDSCKNKVMQNLKIE